MTPSPSPSPPPPPPLAPDCPGRGGPPASGHATPNQARGERDRRPPGKKTSQTAQGTEAGNAEGHGPHGRALLAPRTGTTRGAGATPSRAGRKGADAVRARAHTHKGHAGNTRSATAPSPRNAQTAWNGVPAGEGKGRPDRMTHHTQRGKRGVGGGEREGHNTRHRPQPPGPAAGAAHTPTGHCTRQRSCGAPSHAPALRLGRFRAGPRRSCSYGC